jgi:hypothetical protein
MKEDQWCFFFCLMKAAVNAENPATNPPVKAVRRIIQ